MTQVDTARLQVVEREAAAVASDYTTGTYAYYNIPGTQAVFLKGGLGVLHAITINNPSPNGIIRIYDNTSPTGTRIATIMQPAAGMLYTRFEYDVVFGTGLTVEVAGFGQDITVAYL